MASANTEKFGSTPLLDLPTNSENNKECSDSNIHLTDSLRAHRKHRFTIFIGYGEEAGYVLKRCEQLKCRLGFATNIQFLTYLIEYFEQRNTEYRTNIITVDSSDKNSSKSCSSYIYDVKFKSFNPAKLTNLNIENKINDSSLLSNVISISSSCTEEQNQGKIFQEQINPILNNTHEASKEEEEITLEKQKTEYIPIPSELVPSVSELTTDTMHYESSVFTNITLPAKRKIQMNNNNNTGIKQKSTTPIINRIQQTTEVLDGNVKPVDISMSLTLSAQNIKALKVIHQYMENIKSDLSYYHGYISCSEKLKCFLDDYRFATSTSFTVRSSRSYIKKRALNALRAIKNENSEISTTDNIRLNDMNDVINNHHNENHLTDSIKLPIKSDVKEMRTIMGNTFEVISPDDVQNSASDDDSMITGPLRWEFILGKPPIPFTGVPFFIIGNTQYQCFYATADIRTQRRKEKIAKILKENPCLKTRIRRSMKRDCKAVMCIKSIVTFPEFSIVDKIHGVRSKKGCRKLKATTLDNLRDVVEKGESIGHPAFWVHIPLPEAHSTHDILDNSSKVTDNGNMDEISHILQLAAQYGGHLEVTQHPGADNIVHLNINDTAEELTNNSSVSNEFLCDNDTHTTPHIPKFAPAVSGSP